jgi:hypothetical protein
LLIALSSLYFQSLTIDICLGAWRRPPQPGSARTPSFTLLLRTGLGILVSARGVQERLVLRKPLEQGLSWFATVVHDIGANDATLLDLEQDLFLVRGDVSHVFIV